MAKILLGGGVSGLSGSIGGTTFSRNSNGAYARNKVTPVDSKTPEQLAARSIFTAISTSYRDLTPAQRAGWKDGAPNFPYVDVFGQSKTYTGNQLFMKLNMNLVGVEASTISNLPTPEPLFALLGLGLKALVSTSELVFLNPQTVPTGYRGEVYFSPPVSNSRDFYDVKAMRRFGFIESSVPIGSQDYYADYVARYGVPLEGQKIFGGLRFVNLTTGQASLVFMVNTNFLA